MYSEVKPKKPFEVFTAHSREIWCDGEGGALGHPRVFLHMDTGSDNIVCPYCSREYIYTPPAGGAPGHH